MYIFCAQTALSSKKTFPSYDNRGPVVAPAPTVIVLPVMRVPMRETPALTVAVAPTFHHTFTIDVAELIMRTFEFASKIMSVPMLNTNDEFISKFAFNVRVVEAVMVNDPPVE